MTDMTPPPMWIKRAWSSVLDFCYPSLCPLCEARESDEDSSSRLCSQCRQICQSLGGRQCPRCSASVGPHADTTAGCVHCREERFAFEAVCSIGPYRDLLRSACLRAKTRLGHSVAMAMAHQLGSLHRELLGAWSPHLILPVPHHWWEQVRRAHLSPSTLAETLGAALKIPVRFDLLKKTRYTEKQALLPVTKRKANLRGAFRIGGGATLDGATVLLVDDILTTGATAHECSKVLQQAGATRVYVAVFARAAGH